MQLMMHVYQIRFISSLAVPLLLLLVAFSKEHGYISFFVSNSVFCSTGWTNPFKAARLERNLSCFECFWDMQYITINNATNATIPLALTLSASHWFQVTDFKNPFIFFCVLFILFLFHFSETKFVTNRIFIENWNGNLKPNIFTCWNNFHFLRIVKKN